MKTGWGVAGWQERRWQFGQCVMSSENRYVRWPRSMASIEQGCGCPALTYGGCCQYCRPVVQASSAYRSRYLIKPSYSCRVGLPYDWSLGYVSDRRGPGPRVPTVNDGGASTRTDHVITWLDAPRQQSQRRGSVTHHWLGSAWEHVDTARVDSLR